MGHARIRTLALASGVLALSAITAWGAAIPTAMDRTVSFSTSSQSDIEFSTSAGSFAGFVSGDAAAARQDSLILPLFLGGVGGAAASGNDPAATAQSSFDVRFELSAAHSFTLFGTLDVFESGSATTHSQFRLVGPGTDFFFQAFDDEEDPKQFSEAGLLAPGAYQLTVIADVCCNSPGSSGEGLWIFELFLTEPTAVPQLPALTLLALGAGVLAAVVIRRTGHA